MEDNELFDEPTAQEAAAPSTAQPSIPLDAETVETFDDLAPAQRTPYVRHRTPRRTQEAIDDLAEDDSSVEYAHESNVAVGGMIADRKYRNARSDISRFQKNNRYGQYLEIPKGRRSIFAKRERARRRQSAVAAVVVLGILAIVAYILWQFMSTLTWPF